MACFRMSLFFLMEKFLRKEQEDSVYAFRKDGCSGHFCVRSLELEDRERATKWTVNL